MLGPWISALLLTAPCPERSVWPSPDWPEAIADTAEAEAKDIAALEDYAFTLTGADADRAGIRTDAVLILRGGRLVYERYARGWDRSQKHLAWSVSKSVTATLVGAAVAQGILGVKDSICQVSPRASTHCEVSIDHLLEFASGLDWKEVYENESNQASSVLAMLYGEGHADWARFVLGHAKKYEPGSYFAYSTGDSTLLLSVLNPAAEAKLGRDWPWTLLFDRIGLSSAVFERDARGNIAGGSYFYATARDYLRLGYLYLGDGCWSGQRILPDLQPRL